MTIPPVPYTGLFAEAPPKEPFTGENARHRNKLYNAVLRVARDPDDEFYHRHTDGTLYRRTGAAHRSAFWSGYDSVARPKELVRKLNRGHPTSDAAVCWRAGADFARADLRAQRDPWRRKSRKEIVEDLVLGAKVLS